MSDQNSNEVIDYQRTINLLEKALVRERNAKKRLEQKLDEKAQQRLDESSEFIKAFQEANSRQIQLQFLSMLNQDIISDKNLEEMFDSYTRGLQKLLENCPVLIASLTKKNWQLLHLSSSASDWQRLELNSALIAMLNQFLGGHRQKWNRLEVDETGAFSALLTNSTLLFYIVELSANQQRIIFLDINHFCYSDDFKNTLRVSGHNFTTAINKRMTEVELSYNNQKLKHALKTLEKTQLQLAHKDKMASLGQLSAGIAHEINNPIGYVSSNLDSLSDYLEYFQQAFNALSKDKANQTILNNSQLQFAIEDTPALVAACKNGVERVANIVNSLKTFSRKEHDEFGPTNVNEVINSAIEMIWNQLKYHHQLDLQLSPALPLVYGNFGQLQQVFINLFVNASQAMTENGKLTVTSQWVADAVEVTVTDTGCGIAPKNLKRLFEPFYTTKDENEGTGLGLSVSYAIIEKHNAIISVNSAIAQGTTFTLRFPALPANFDEKKAL
ncbi:hypothetical protein LP316_14185 [Thalassotalea sp. LPB0316]|uniref:sensor histidine kinase n=1 Tax=Thalassotalea sp. LPB0316 TaxID=2769490 RepID=UPI001869464D|nr:ATP-binding protein [Thalassotalea sp. LPB0316]QOL25428.1 hypothetical protein LP316_14185 [Thalassotalea sp. LPB0316]